jgi:NTE family protein
MAKAVKTRMPVLSPAHAFNKSVSILSTICEVLVLLILSVDIDQAAAEPILTEQSGERPVIGLVLSGGGARGASHIGVLKALEELHIPIDIITGTSMGAIVGGMYANGYSVEEIEKLLIETDWDAVFRDEPPRKNRSFRRKQDDYSFLIKQEAGIKDGNIIIPKGLLQGQQLRLRLKSLTLLAPKDFDELPIRFRAVAADIESGEAVALGDGSLSTAMHASMAIPGVFAPVEWKGHLLVDGGFANNVPVQLARELGADILIVVDLSSKLQGRHSLSSPFSILNQILAISIQNNTAEQLEKLNPDDILLQPDLSNYSSTDFWRVSEMIDSGVLEVNLNTQRLSKLSVSEDEYSEYVTAIRQRDTALASIDKITIDNQSPLSPEILKSHITIEAGYKLDISALEEDIHQLYGMNIFERVDYDVLQDEQQTELVVEAKEKAWGPQYLRFGLSVESDFEGGGIFNLATSHTMTPINRLGGELRSEIQVGHDQRLTTELYQPIDNPLRYYFRTSLGYYETHVGQYESGHQVADLDVTYSSFLLAAGRQFGNWGQLEFGAYTASGDSSPFIGDLSIPTQDINSGAWVVTFMYDQLDSINIPRSGSMANISWAARKEGLGADAEYDSLHANGLWAGTWNKHTLMFWAGIAGVTNANAPAENIFSLGGLFNLSGYHRSELAGRYAGIARLVYLKELSESRSVLKVPVYLGISLEAGNIWNERDEISFDSLIPAGSICLSIDSPLGPVYLARGFAEEGHSATYLFIGRTFTFL